MKYLFKIIIIIFISILANGCDLHKKDQNDLEKEIEKSRKEAIEKVPALPAFNIKEQTFFKPGFDPFSYTLPGLPIIGQERREKGPLEQFPISSFKFSGVVADEGNVEAIFISPDGYFYRGRLGDYIGSENGRITKIDSEGIVEITQPRTTFTGKGFEEKIILKNTIE